MALPFFFQVNAGDYFGRLIALRKHDAYVLVIVCIAFQCVHGAGIAFDIAFAIIDVAVFHDVLHFGLGNLAAFHAAAGVFGVFKERCSPVKATVAVYGGLAGF